MHYHPLPLPIPSHQGKNKTTTTRDISRKKVDGGGEGGEQSSCRNNTGLAIHSPAVNGLDNGNKWLRQFESDGTNSQRKQNRIHFTLSRTSVRYLERNVIKRSVSVLACGVVMIMAPSTYVLLKYCTMDRCSSEVPGGVSTTRKSTSPQSTSRKNCLIKPDNRHNSGGQIDFVQVFTNL